MDFTAHGCGKLILAGEHAVVHGIPAIAVGIDRGAHARVHAAARNRLRIAPWGVDVAERDDDDLARAFAALIASARSRGNVPAVEIDAATDLPAGGGLGCSAALGVAVARAVALAVERDTTDDDIRADAMAWEKIFHGNPSGVDAAVAALGGAIQFVRDGARSTIERLDPSGSLVFAIGHSGRASSTRDMVTGIARLREQQPAMVGAAFERIRVIVAEVRGAIESGDLAALGAALDENQIVLHKLALSTSDIDTMCTSARSAGALGCKLTGAGGGGCVVALAEGHASAERILSAWRAHHKEGFVAELGTPRSRGHAPASDSITAI
jgi:mevalonate kinase